MKYGIINYHQLKHEHYCLRTDPNLKMGKMQQLGYPLSQLKQMGKATLK